MSFSEEMAAPSLLMLGHTPFEPCHDTIRPVRIRGYIIAPLMGLFHDGPLVPDGGLVWLVRLVCAIRSLGRT